MLDKNYNSDVGNRIRKYRKLKHLTMKELGERIGMSEGNVSRYERGELALDVKQLMKIAKALDVPPKKLAGWCDEPTQKEEMVNKWIDKVGELNFNEKELDELISYAQFIVSKRGDK
uniref:Helix-turn-helix domain protein n=1 Tax=Siphoviridae sp. ctulf7 TaxID=2826505 RepID=A0A8S5M5I2_9CAUD|nr:MAG TPA: helix-turn-helix domain protein [Siphoviridae sp. ctulf7]